MSIMHLYYDSNISNLSNKFLNNIERFILKLFNLKRNVFKLRIFSSYKEIHEL